MRIVSRTTLLEHLIPETWKAFLTAGTDLEGRGMEGWVMSKLLSLQLIRVIFGAGKYPDPIPLYL